MKRVLFMLAILTVGVMMSCAGTATQTAAVQAQDQTLSPRMLLNRGILRGDVALIEEAVAGGVDVNADLNDMGNCPETALISAIAQPAPSVEVVRALLEAGADVDGDSNPPAQDGRAIIKASCQGHTDIVRLLIEYGADVNYRGGFNNATAIERAAGNGHTEIVELLLAAGATL